MVIIGKSNKTNIGILPHLDEDDVISCIITLGSLNNGSVKNNLFEVKKISVPFKHCQLPHKPLLNIR